MARQLPRIGLFLAYWPWIPPEEQLALAQLADERGLDSVWVAESWGSETSAVLGWLAGQTTRVGLGTALMQIPARKPTTAAMAAMSVDVVSGGRMRLGLGLSGPQVSEGWYGVPFGEPLRRTREYVAVVRGALDGEKVSSPMEAGGKPTGMGKALKMLSRPVQEHLPIYLGALGPKAVEQCFAIADGWMPFVVGTDMLAEHPRPDRPFDVSPILPVAVAEDVATARDAVRPWLTFYLGAMGTPKKHFLVELAEREGHTAAREVQRRFLDGDRDGAAAALDDDLIDAMAVATTPDRLPERLAAFKDAGADTVIAAIQGDRRAAALALADVAASG